MLFRCFCQQHSQSTIARPAHYVLSAWALGEKTKMLGMFLLSQARAREPIGVQHNVIHSSLLVLQQKINMPTVQETAVFCAWNHCCKLDRRCPPRTRARKQLSLRHTHGSAPRRLYLPCQIVDQCEISKLKQNYRISSPRQKNGGKGGSSCLFIMIFSVCRDKSLFW